MSSPDLIRSHTGKNRDSFDRNTLSEQHRIAHPCAGGSYDPARRTFSQQTAHHDRTSHGIRNLAMASTQGHMEATADPMKLAEETCHRGGSGGMSRQQYSGQKPLRLRTHGRQVVGVDQQCIRPDLIRHESDGIGLRDQYSVAETNRRCIQTDASSYQYPRVLGCCKASKEHAKQVNRNLPERERRPPHSAHRINASRQSLTERFDMGDAGYFILTVATCPSMLIIVPKALHLTCMVRVRNCHSCSLARLTPKSSIRVGWRVIRAIRFFSTSNMKRKERSFRSSLSTM